MRHLYLGSVAAVALAPGMALADYTLTILHINDFHDRFEAVSASGSRCSDEAKAEGKCFGGIARLVPAIAAARAQHENSLLLDGGDQFQGTLFHTQYLGAMSAEFMNQIGFEAMAVGNHEFNHGVETLAAYARALEFPFLMANADLTGEAALAAEVQKSVVIEKAGERIGIIGLTPVNVPELSSPGPNIVFTDPVEATQGEVDRLTAEGVNKIILLSHSGLAEDLRIAEGVTGVDIIVGGHSHTLLSNTVEGAAGPYPTVANGVPIVQAGAYGMYLGALTVTWDDAGNVVSATGDVQPLDASVAEDEAVLARVAELGAPLEAIRNEVVAESATEIDGTRENCRARECAMGNLVAEAMLDRVKDQGVQIAIANGGGLRASIDAGPVTKGEVLTVLPFQNSLSTFQVTGEALLAALENGVSQVEEGSGRFPQVAGMRYTFDLSQPAGSRVSDVMVAEGDTFVPLDPAKVYGVVSNDFVRKGGDGFAMFVDAQNAYDFGPDLADVTAEFLATNAPYTPFLDGRITQK
ncbi:MAG: 5'-nucleotidase C-terminal domain-containing protein [Rhodobacteraceae bacterium]|jgi:5'-nucleotidase|nr:5'-nucleotidase C-terminal domain-containing protein [Paracoccaceae bacterium]